MTCDVVHEPLQSEGAGRLLPPQGMFTPERIDRAERLERVPAFERLVEDHPTPAQKAGLSYEKRVKSRLAGHFGPPFDAGVWFSYLADGGLKRSYCQVDGLINAVCSPIVFEIKLRWCDTAWWQLVRLYGPVVKRALLSSGLPSLVAVVRSYDPAVVVPGPVKLLKGLNDCPYLAAGEVGVLVWK